MFFVNWVLSGQIHCILLKINSLWVAIYNGISRQWYIIVVLKQSLALHYFCKVFSYNNAEIYQSYLRKNGVEKQWIFTEDKVATITQSSRRFDNLLVRGCSIKCQWPVEYGRHFQHSREPTMNCSTLRIHCSGNNYRFILYHLYLY